MYSQLIQSLIANSNRGYDFRSSYTFDDAVDGSVYSASGYPAGVGIVGDYGLYTRGYSVAQAGMSIRFPTQTEGGGSNNSLYRTQQLFTSSYLNYFGLNRVGLVTFYVYIPNGGTNSRLSSPGDNSTSIFFYFYGASRQNIFYIDTPGVIGFQARQDFSTDFTLDTPDQTLDVSSYSSNGWHKVEVQWNNSSFGSYRLKWDDALELNWSGDTDVGNSDLYITYPGGGVISNDDLQYFGALDEINLTLV